MRCLRLEGERIALNTSAPFGESRRSQKLMATRGAPNEKMGKGTARLGLPEKNAPGYSVTDRDAYSGVKAYWNDTRGAERKTVLAGSGDNAKQLHPTYATEDDALAAARAEWQRIQRGLAEFELTLALGRADILPESPLTISGYKPQIDATA